VNALESEGALEVGRFIASIDPAHLHRPQGTAVYLTPHADFVPSRLLHNLKHNHVLHRRVVLLTIDVTDVPHVPAGERATISRAGKGVHWVTLHHGFMGRRPTLRPAGQSRRGARQPYRDLGPRKRPEPVRRTEGRVSNETTRLKCRRVCISRVSRG
jgi:hypothetical protein